MLMDGTPCGHSWDGRRFGVSAGKIDPNHRTPGLPEHPEFKRWMVTKWAMFLCTDDLAEAEGAWPTAERWVRTGVFDD